MEIFNMDKEMKMIRFACRENCERSKFQIEYKFNEDEKEFEFILLHITHVWRTSPSHTYSVYYDVLGKYNSPEEAIEALKKKQQESLDQALSANSD